MGTCAGCKHDKEAPDGICARRLSEEDQLPLRCVGEWSRHKFYYVRRYLEASQTAMRKKWPVRNYFDLFCGPGRCIDRDSEQELDGSPLIALRTKPPFTNYYFLDANPVCIDALETRCAQFSDASISLEKADCNAAIKGIVERFDRRSLNVVLVDPTGLDVSMETLAYLGEGAAVDLIINFPFHSAVKRNIRRFVLRDKSRLDWWMGSPGWRDAFDEGSRKGWKHAVQNVVDFYKLQLRNAGYPYVSLGYVAPIKAGSTSLYYLLLASKNQRGVEIWERTSKILSSGQRRLF